MSNLGCARAGADRPARARRRGPAPGEGTAGDAGSQTLELALLTPWLVALVLLMLLAALTGADLIGAQTLAREGARAAARGIDAHEHVRAAAGGREVRVQLSPAQPVPGQAVTVTVHLRSHLSERLGLPVWLPGRATMLREPGP